MTDVASAVSGVEPGYQGILSQMQKNDRESDEANKGYIKKIEDTKTPSPPVLTPPPKPEQSDPLNGFGSAATWLATFGSMLTRKPLTNALNATADVMDAHKAQDAANFKKKWDTWKMETENAWKMAEWNESLYKDMIGKTEAEQKITASSTKNHTLEMAIQARMADSYHKDMVRQIKQGNEAKERINRLVEDEVGKQKKVKEATGGTWTRHDDDMAYYKASQSLTKGGSEEIDWNSLKPQDKVPGTGLTKASVEQKVEGLHTGSRYTDLGISMRTTKNPEKDAIDDLWALKYPDDNVTNIRIEQLGKQTEEKIGAKNLEGMRVATDRLDKSIPLLLQKVQKIDPERFKNWNEFENFLNENTGDPDIVALKQVVQDTKTDFQAVQAKGGQVTDRVRGDSDEILNAAWAKGQFKAATDTMLQTSRNQMAAARESLKSVTASESSQGTEKTYSSAKEVKDAVSKGVLKRGDTFLDPDGNPHRVK